MSKKEFIFSDKKISIEKREDVGSSYKINAYKTKLKLMQERKIPQKDINDLLNHFFNKNTYISKKTKNSISKIICAQKVKILILINHSGKDILVNRDRLVRDYGWFFFISKTEKDSKQQKVKDKITIFNHTVSWVELDKILSEAHKVIRWLIKEPPIISRAFAYKLRSYGEMSRRYEEERKINYLKYVPLLTYDISRNLTKEEQKEAYIWAEDLRPSKDKPKGGDNLPYLETIMEFVLTYTRS